MPAIWGCKQNVGIVEWKTDLFGLIIREKILGHQGYCFRIFVFLNIDGGTVESCKILFNAVEEKSEMLPSKGQACFSPHPK